MIRLWWLNLWGAGSASEPSVVEQFSSVRHAYERADANVARHMYERYRLGGSVRHDI